MNDSVKETTSNISVKPVVSVGDFAALLGVSPAKIITELMKNGVMATINEQIDFDTASIIGVDLGFNIVPEEVESKPVVSSRVSNEGTARPPVIAVMGHVDHGKTSLLDAIRKTDVASSEAGGITQHIAAYQIKHNDRLITFLDTPGHEAFSALRAHGAKMTDVAIIVVAADDGVKPQTIEAIDHAKQAGIQMVVAINKIDKEGADANRVRQQLAELELVPEEWGGKTVMADISAKTGLGIDKLLDMVLLVTDIEEIKARPDGLSEGVVVESHIQKGMGPQATILVQQGELRLGDFLVTGETYGKVRTLEDYQGRKIKSAGPSTPVIVSGLKSLPAFGDYFQAATSEREAKDQVLASEREQSIKSLSRVKKIGVDELNSAISAGQIRELNLIVKADTQGSLESLLGSLSELKNEEVAAKVVSSSAGDILESDVNFARGAGAMILGFHVSVSPTVRQLALKEQVTLRIYKVIYELIDDVRDMLSQLLPEEVIETTVARLEVLEVFRTTKQSVICGGRVVSGKVEPALAVKIFRSGEEVGKAKLTNLKKEQQDVKMVLEGELCGISLDTNSAVSAGDELVFYTTETKARRLA